MFEDEFGDKQSLVVVEEELEFPIDIGYTLLEAMHDSTTLEPTYEESVTLLREMHVPTPMNPSHDQNFALYCHLGESRFILLHPTLPYFAGFILMKYGLKVYF